MHPLFQRTLEAYRPVSLRGQMLDGVLRTPTSVAAHESSGNAGRAVPGKYPLSRMMQALPQILFHRRSGNS